MSAAPSLDVTFAALADSTRRAILARLMQGEASVNDLVEPFELSQPTISKHLKVLERAGLIERRKDAQFRRCRLNAAHLEAAWSWLGGYREFWEGAFDRLESTAKALQAEAKAKENSHGRKKPKRRRPGQPKGA